MSCDHTWGHWEGFDEAALLTGTPEDNHYYADDSSVEWFDFCPQCGAKLDTDAFRQAARDRRERLRAERGPVGKHTSEWARATEAMMNRQIEKVFAHTPAWTVFDPKSR